MEEPNFANIYIERLVSEITESVKTKLLLESQLLYAKKLLDMKDEELASFNSGDTDLKEVAPSKLDKIKKPAKE